MYILAQARGGGNDPLRHHPVRRAGLQPLARLSSKRSTRPASGPASGPGHGTRRGPGQPRGPARLAVNGRGHRARPPVRRHRHGRRFGPSPAARRGHHRGRRPPAPTRSTRAPPTLPWPGRAFFFLHKSTSENEVALQELAAFGERPVAHMAAIGALHERVLLNHMTSLDDGDVRAVVDSGARVSQNPTSALKLAKGTTQTGKWKALADAGVPMALGTDAENVSNHQDICRAMQLAALLSRDCSATRTPSAGSRRWSGHARRRDGPVVVR